MNVEELVAQGGDADDILRRVVTALVEDGGCAWAGILLAEGDELVLGPQAGKPDPGLRVQLPVVWEGTRVAELVADGCDERDLLDSVATAIAPYCLVGWDTGGEPWTP